MTTVNQTSNMTAKKAHSAIKSLRAFLESGGSNATTNTLAKNATTAEPKKLEPKDIKKVEAKK